MTSEPTGDPPTVAAPLRARLRSYWRAIGRFAHMHRATGNDFWVADAPDKPEVVLDTNTMLVPKGWHKWKRTDMAAILSLADVVVVNYGLHYHGPPGHPELKLSDYHAQMEGLFAQLEAFGRLPGKAAVFRETSAQHFTGTGSYAGDQHAHPGAGKGCHCQAMSPEVVADNDVTRYNDVIHSLATTCVLRAQTCAACMHACM